MAVWAPSTTLDVLTHVILTTELWSLKSISLCSWRNQGTGSLVTCSSSLNQGKSPLSWGWKGRWHRKGFLHRSWAAPVSEVPGWAGTPARTAAHSHTWMCLSRAHSSSFSDLPTHGCFPGGVARQVPGPNNLAGAHSVLAASIPAWTCWLPVWSFIQKLEPTQA